MSPRTTESKPVAANDSPESFSRLAVLGNMLSKLDEYEEQLVQTQ